jgi:hypothetical protein
VGFTESEIFCVPIVPASSLWLGADSYCLACFLQCAGRKCSSQLVKAGQMLASTVFLPRVSLLSQCAAVDFGVCMRPLDRSPHNETASTCESKISMERAQEVWVESSKGKWRFCSRFDAVARWQKDLITKDPKVSILFCIFRKFLGKSYTYFRRGVCKYSCRLANAAAYSFRSLFGATLVNLFCCAIRRAACIP